MQNLIHGSAGIIGLLIVLAIWAFSQAAVSPLVRFETAARNQVSRELNDAVMTRHSFPGLLMAMDNFYGVPNTRFIRSDDVSGLEIQVDFRIGLPTWAGVTAQTGALSVLSVADSEGFTVVGGKIGYSAYQGAENIRRHRINRHQKSPASLVNYVQKVSEGMADGLLIKLDTDLFPASNMVDNATTYNAAEDHVMAFAYPLQKPAAGVYEYLSLNLNSNAGGLDYTQIKAVVYGDTSGAAAFGTPTPSNLRRRLVFPLQQRKAKVDFGICDSDVLDYMLSFAENSVVIDMADKLNFGGLLVRFAGISWMPHERMDLLTNRKEIYVGDSSKHRWHNKGMSDSFDVLKVPGAPGKVIMQGYFEGCYCNDNPRMNGRGVDVRLS